ncbi:MAG: helix-turn-helix domain-containing protein, partial [Proteobacteria bacterium]|nr:helix-turn-helix domain-containing protein [Pseudomonadota bacterium]
MAAKRQDDLFVRSLAKGLQVIEAFGEEKSSHTLSDIARATGLTRATARRLLHTLVRLGYAEHEDKRFSLSPRVLNLGYSYLTSLGLWNLAEPFMEDLVSVVKESCSASVLDGFDVVYVARVPTRARIMSITLNIGTRLPCHATSMGRVLLAGLPADPLAHFLCGP